MGNRERRDRAAKGEGSRAWHKHDGAVRLGIEPYRQGELDSLCGIYAVINALYALCPEMDEHLAEMLFRKLVTSLGKHVERPVGTLYDGLGQSAVEGLLAIGAEEIRRELEVRIKASAYKRPARTPSLGEFWEDLRSHVHRRQVAILGLSGADEHWTVAYAMSSKLIRLLDSAERHVLRRSRCTISRARSRYRIDPAAVILVKRSK
jgi:hypothetical protein